MLRVLTLPLLTLPPFLFIFSSCWSPSYFFFFSDYHQVFFVTSCLPPSPSIPSHLCCLTLLFCSSFQRLCNPQIIPRFTDTPLPPFHLLLTFAQLPLLFPRLLPALSSVPSSLPAHSVSGPHRPDSRYISRISN